RRRTMLGLRVSLFRFAVAAAMLVFALVAGMPARAQSGFDRPGGDYSNFFVRSGDPAACAARCERDGRCRAWSFSYPGTAALGGRNLATSWLKNQVKPLVAKRSGGSRI